MAFLYTSNELSERETTQENLIYYSNNKKIKYPGINLITEVKDLC